MEKITRHDRVDVADALRGLAVLGIILLHSIEHFNFGAYPDTSTQPLWLNFTDSAIWDGLFFMFGGKAYAVFALLFGFSFFIQDDNQRMRGNDFRKRFCWRLTLLFIIGNINAMFFTGEVLVLFSIVGFSLVAVCRMKTRTVMWIAAICLLQPVEIYYIVRGIIDPTYMAPAIPWQEWWRVTYEYQSSGNFWQMAKVNLWEGQLFSLGWAWDNGRFFQTAGIFMLGMLFPIVYNFGTNIFLGQISYITEALATVLQLGVTMDFSIFLLHRYEEEKLTAASDEDAMVAAIKKTFSSITGSSLTTIAGFLAMCTMQLTLGEDIGVVMAKGVLLGVICTITVLPSLIMTFRRAIEKHTHRTFIPKLKRTSNFVVKHRVPILIAFIIIFIPFFIAQSKTSVYYTIFDALPQDLPGIAGTNRLKEDFDMTTSHFIIVDDTLSEKNLSDLSDELSDVDGIHQVLSYEKFVGGAIPEMFIPDDVRDIFEAGGHKMILANSSYKSGSDEQNNQLSEMIDIVKKYDPNGVITGEGAMTKDLIEVADVDFNNVNITSIIVVFVIIAIVFRSASVPVLLVAAIESAIMINLGIPYFTGTTLPFITSIVIGTIQLGATVDYAILMTTRFREERNAGHTAKEAAQIAVEQCSQSILTSGLTFFAATFSVSLVSRMELIGVLCKLISRGALISMAVILLVLPALLVITEPILRKTTFHWLKKPEITEKKA